jgi:hypothetical protein
VNAYVSVLSADGSSMMFGASRWLEPELNEAPISAATHAAPRAPAMDSFFTGSPLPTWMRGRAPGSRHDGRVQVGLRAGMSRGCLTGESWRAHTPK